MKNEATYWKIAAVVFAVIACLVVGLSVLPDRADPGPRPILVQYEDQVYLLGFAEGDSITTEEAREINHNVLAFIVSQSGDPAMRAAMEAVGFTGPRNVTDQVRVDPGG